MYETKRDLLLLNGRLHAKIRGLKSKKKRNLSAIMHFLDRRTYRWAICNQMSYDSLDYRKNVCKKLGS